MTLPFIISGLVTGAVYGLAGVGLVLTYKTSGIFNFAHGALATVAAYVFYTLHVEHSVAWPLAAALAIVGVALPLAVVLEVLGRSIVRGGLAIQVAATVGILLIVQSAITLIYGLEQTRTVPVFLAHGQTHIGSTPVQWSDIDTFVIAVVATAGLYLFFRLTRAGTAMRAIVDNPELLGLAGTNPVRVRRLAWFIGVALAAGSGVLFSPILQLDPTLLTLLVVQAFGAAALGAFTSLPLTFAGGLAIGVLASMSTKWFTSGVLTGLPPAIPFLVLFVVLLIFPKRYLVEHSKVVPRDKTTWTAPPLLQAGGGLALLAVLALAPSFAGIHLDDWTTMLGTIVIFLSLGLLVRVSGQVSLSQVAFAAIGACAFGHLTLDSGLPWLVALLAAGLIAVPVGAFLAIPAMRLTSLYLALATFGFGVALSYMLYTQSFMFGDQGNGVDIPRPASLGLGLDTDKGYYYVVLAFVALFTVFVVALNRSRLGRLLRGMADSPTALTTSGTSVNVTRLLVFCISAFMAAVGGALVGAGQGTITAESYPPLLSLTYLALIVICPGREPWYAVIAGAALILPPSYITDAKTSYWMTLLFGAAAVLYALAPNALRIPPVLRAAIDRRFPRPRKRHDLVADAAGGGARTPVADAALEVEQLTVRFGGLVAVDRMSLRAPTGRITGLIGPNGAGKTTTFNACSGLLRPREGRIAFDGNDITRSTPAGRAQRGLGRTFQRMELFDSLSVWDNVVAGAEGSRAGFNPVHHVFRTRRDRRRIEAATADALALCELTDLADRPAGSLSTGQRRLVELARCLAGPFRLLLLDEPSSGLDKAETERFAAILRRVVEERGVGILLVEHDMSLVMDVCEHIYVLDFGKPLFDGTPADVLASPIVRAAYLGDDSVPEMVAIEKESV